METTFTKWGGRSGKERRSKTSSAYREGGVFYYPSFQRSPGLKGEPQRKPTSWRGERGKQKKGGGEWE
ncbi:MAG: hypothetical protein C6I01_05175 [Epsilonproteobacteria bacterium]|nr:hypothetical protein [Campylobacterota bacterium]